MARYPRRRSILSHSASSTHINRGFRHRSSTASPFQILKPSAAQSGSPTVDVVGFPNVSKSDLTNSLNSSVTHDGGSEKWKTSEANDTRTQEGTLTSRQATTEYNHDFSMPPRPTCLLYTNGAGSVTAVTRGAATVGKAPMLIKFSKPFKLIGILSAADAIALSHTPVQEVTM
ncbi:hypothetical protein BU15DRAFT_66906 [Melanogaster broomeanus]|nr:hypothetical protein BU15DRAFT_66906 [Melanogaster broomeanus]